MNTLRVALCGNPNVGKSTVFNALTGLRQHTGNWAGKTVESACGQVRDGALEWSLIDLPGAYSLLNGSPEEIVASDYLTFHTLDAVIVVCDATCLERNLHLALQIAEACPGRVIICVNLMDEAKKRRIEIDLRLLEELLDMPVVGITAKRRVGLDVLKRRVAETGGQPRAANPSLLVYHPELEAALDTIAQELDRVCPKVCEAGTAHFAALRSLVGDDAFLRRLLEEASREEQASLEETLRSQNEALTRLGFSREKRIADVVAEGYRAAGALCAKVVRRPVQSRAEARQLRIDRLLSSKRAGIPLMLCLLAFILYITLSGANIPSAWLSDVLTSFEPPISRFLFGLGAPEWLVGLLVEGVYRVTSWVVSVMLPPMAIFFPLFTLLEDFGFLPRVAFNLDRCFQKCHACGKQALCMCMGFFRVSFRTSLRGVGGLLKNAKHWD